ncbi:MAG: hypothetical protein PHU03_07035, partial [Syntrophales bacterium]|nr:hypothetical protein [Syntrophales bacterium]
LFHYRETRGTEIDLLVDQGRRLAAVEIKSASTISEDFFKNLKRFKDRMKEAGHAKEIQNYIVYGGNHSQKRSQAQILPWNQLPQLLTERETPT